MTTTPETVHPCTWPDCLSPGQQAQLADQVTASMHGQRPTCGCTEAVAAPDNDVHVCKPGASLYYCPTAGETESDCHGGFDVCCDRPGLHQPLVPCSLAVLKRPHGGHSWEPQPGAPLVRCEGCSATGQQTEPDNTRADKRRVQLARAMGLREDVPWLELIVAAVKDHQGLKRVQARVEQAEGILRDLIDPDPCWYDHHGYCQAHGWFATEPACPHARAKALLNPPAPDDHDEEGQ